MHAPQSHMGSTIFDQEAEWNEKKAQANAFIGFSAEKAKQGRINSQDWWVSIILAGSGLWEQSLGTLHLVLGWFRAEESDVVCESSMKKVVGGYGLRIGWVEYESCVHA